STTLAHAYRFSPPSLTSCPSPPQPPLFPYTTLFRSLSAAGLRAIAAGNVGLPLTTAVLERPRYDALAVELSSFQLHWSSALGFRSEEHTSNSSHGSISYAVFCLKKKKKKSACRPNAE